MARDGTNRGGRRVRAGAKPEPLVDRLADGRTGRVLRAEDMPETHDFTDAEIRTISENATQLKFQATGFEEAQFGYIRSDLDTFRYVASDNMSVELEQLFDSLEALPTSAAEQVSSLDLSHRELVEICQLYHNYLFNYHLYTCALERQLDDEIRVNPDWILSDDIPTLVNALAGNIISSGHTFTEFLRARTHRYLPQGDQKNKFEQFLDGLYDQKTAYYFFSEFRNMYQHGQLLVSTYETDGKLYACFDLFQILNSINYKFQASRREHFENLLQLTLSDTGQSRFSYLQFIEQYNVQLHAIFNEFLLQTRTIFESQIDLSRTITKENDQYFADFDDSHKACKIVTDEKADIFLFSPDKFESFHRRLSAEIKVQFTNFKSTYDSNYKLVTTRTVATNL